MNGAWCSGGDHSWHDYKEDDCYAGVSSKLANQLDLCIPLILEWGNKGSWGRKGIWRASESFQITCGLILDKCTQMPQNACRRSKTHARAACPKAVGCIAWNACNTTPVMFNLDPIHELVVGTNLGGRSLPCIRAHLAAGSTSKILFPPLSTHFPHFLSKTLSGNREDKIVPTPSGPHYGGTTYVLQLSDPTLILAF